MERSYTMVLATNKTLLENSLIIVCSVQLSDLVMYSCSGCFQCIMSFGLASVIAYAISFDRGFEETCNAY